MTKQLRLAAFVAASLPVLGAPICAAADGAPKHVRGSVSAFTSTTLTIATSSGPVVVGIGPKTGFAGASPASVADITSGTYIGSANVPGAGPARALEVTVFPNAMRGTGEGDYAWDLPATSGAHSSMTNGTVAAPKTSSMTNATVSHVSGTVVKTITVAYKGGTKQIAISPTTPIVKVAPGSSKLLVTGAHVFAIVPAPANGKPVAAFVVVGVGGTVPPQ